MCSSDLKLAGQLVAPALRSGAGGALQASYAGFDFAGKVNQY